MSTVMTQQIKDKERELLSEEQKLHRYCIVLTDFCSIKKIKWNFDPGTPSCYGLKTMVDYNKSSSSSPLSLPSSSSSYQVEKRTFLLFD